MNEWLDKGFFTIAWVSFMWIADLFLSNTGVISYGALMIAGIVCGSIGVLIEVKRKWRNR